MGRRSVKEKKHTFTSRLAAWIQDGFRKEKETGKQKPDTSDSDLHTDPSVKDSPQKSGKVSSWKQKLSKSPKKCQEFPRDQDDSVSLVTLTDETDVSNDSPKEESSTGNSCFEGLDFTSSKSMSLLTEIELEWQRQKRFFREKQIFDSSLSLCSDKDDQVTEGSQQACITMDTSERAHTALTENRSPVEALSGHGEACNINSVNLGEGSIGQNVAKMYDGVYQDSASISQRSQSEQPLTPYNSGAILGCREVEKIHGLFDTPSQINSSPTDNLSMKPSRAVISLSVDSSNLSSEVTKSAVDKSTTRPTRVQEENPSLRKINLPFNDQSRAITNSLTEQMSNKETTLSENSTSNSIDSWRNHPTNQCFNHRQRVNGDCFRASKNTDDFSSQEPDTPDADEHCRWTQSQADLAEKGLHAYGWDWSAIASLVGRSEEECRNFFFCNYRSLQLAVLRTRHGLQCNKGPRKTSPCVQQYSPKWLLSPSESSPKSSYTSCTSSSAESLTSNSTPVYLDHHVRNKVSRIIKKFQQSIDASEERRSLEHPHRSETHVNKYHLNSSNVSDLHLLCKKSHRRLRTCSHKHRKITFTPYKIQNKTRGKKKKEKKPKQALSYSGILSKDKYRKTELPGQILKSSVCDAEKFQSTNWSSNEDQNQRNLADVNSMDFTRASESNASKSSTEGENIPNINQRPRARENSYLIGSAKTNSSTESLERFQSKRSTVPLIKEHDSAKPLPQIPNSETHTVATSQSAKPAEEQQDTVDITMIKMNNSQLKAAPTASGDSMSMVPTCDTVNVSQGEPVAINSIKESEERKSIECSAWRPSGIKLTGTTSISNIKQEAKCQRMKSRIPRLIIEKTGKTARRGSNAKYSRMDKNESAESPAQHSTVFAHNPAEQGTVDNSSVKTSDERKKQSLDTQSTADNDFSLCNSTVKLNSCPNLTPSKDAMLELNEQPLADTTDVMKISDTNPRLGKAYKNSSLDYSGNSLNKSTFPTGTANESIKISTDLHVPMSQELKQSAVSAEAQISCQMVKTLRSQGVLSTCFNNEHASQIDNDCCHMAKVAPQALGGNSSLQQGRKHSKLECDIFEMIREGSKYKNDVHQMINDMVQKQCPIICSSIKEPQTLSEFLDGANPVSITQCGDLKSHSSATHSGVKQSIKVCESEKQSPVSKEEKQDSVVSPNTQIEAYQTGKSDEAQDTSEDTVHIATTNITMEWYGLEISGQAEKNEYLHTSQTLNEILYENTNPNQEDYDSSSCDDEDTVCTSSNCTGSNEEYLCASDTSFSDSNSDSWSSEESQSSISEDRTTDAFIVPRNESAVPSADRSQPQVIVTCYKDSATNKPACSSKDHSVSKTEIPKTHLVKLLNLKANFVSKPKNAALYLPTGSVQNARSQGKPTENTLNVPSNRVFPSCVSYTSSVFANNAEKLGTDDYTDPVRTGKCPDKMFFSFVQYNTQGVFPTHWKTPAPWRGQIRPKAIKEVNNKRPSLASSHHYTEHKKALPECCIQSTPEKEHLNKTNATQNFGHKLETNQDAAWKTDEGEAALQKLQTTVEEDKKKGVDTSLELQRNDFFMVKNTSEIDGSSAEPEISPDECHGQSDAIQWTNETWASRANEILKDNRYVQVPSRQVKSSCDRCSELILQSTSELHEDDKHVPGPDQDGVTSNCESCSEQTVSQSQSTSEPRFEVPRRRYTMANLERKLRSKQRRSGGGFKRFMPGYNENRERIVPSRLSSQAD